jgi:hypothetical protein
MEAAVPPAELGNAIANCLIAVWRPSRRVLLAVQPRKAKDVLAEIDEAYEGRHTDTQFVEKLEKQRS